MENEEITYGTPNSPLLKEVIKAGFKPIAITTMMCEETFIFRGSKEAQEAWNKFKPEGWWYDLNKWYKDHETYIKEYRQGETELAPTIYWLNESYRPR